MHQLHIKLLSLFLVLLPALTWALPSDRDQPIDIEADHAQLDDTQGITQYKGNAILTQGSLRIEGDIITFYYDDDKQLIKAVADGNLAKYQQVQTKGKDPIKARAFKMEYFTNSQKINLLGQAHVLNNGDEFSGERINYDINKNIVSVGSLPQKKGSKPTKSSGRVHIIIQPPNRKGAKASTTTKIIKPTSTTPTAVSGTSFEEGKVYSSATTRSNLNVRTGPGVSYKKIGTFSRGSTLTVLTEQKEWLQVRGTVKNQPVIGWVINRYIDRN